MEEKMNEKKRKEKKKKKKKIESEDGEVLLSSLFLKQPIGRLLFFLVFLLTFEGFGVVREDDSCCGRGSESLSSLSHE